MENEQERKQGRDSGGLLGYSNGVSKASGVKVGEGCEEKQYTEQPDWTAVQEWGHARKSRGN